MQVLNQTNNADNLAPTSTSGATGAASGSESSAEDAQEFVLPVERTFTEWAIRVLNILVALTGIVMTLPVMLLACVMVKASSPGPVIFSQRRVGYCRRRKERRSRPEARVARRNQDRRDDNDGGLIFTIYKFRTMTVAEQPKEEWATPQDPRITSIGMMLRKTRIDELPQLFNVLLGDMSIVGPRPEQPGIFVDLRTQVDGYAFRQKVKPGITGLAQVSLGYDQTIEDVERKVEKDLEYIKGRGFWRDLGIMAKTIPVMLFRKGSM